MLRREFMVLLGSAAVYPLAATAQPGKAPRIGILVLGNPDPAPFLKEFREGLRELGYVEGQSIVFEFRTANGSAALLQSLAHELVALKVDLIVGFQTPAAMAAKQATTDIPVLMTSADPVGTGLVASVARPGGNVTGVSGASGELGGKNLELIREVLPSARRVAVLANAPDPFHKPFLENILISGQALGIEIKPILLRGAEEFEAGFAEMEKWRAEAVIVQPSLPHQRMAEMAIKQRLPSFAAQLEFSRSGRPDGLLVRPIGALSRNGDLRRQDPQRPQAGGSAGPTPNQVSTDRQSQDRGRNRPDAAADAAHPRRPGDRVERAR